MRVLTINELMRLTRTELCGLASLKRLIQCPVSVEKIGCSTES